MESPENNNKLPPPLPPARPVVRKIRFDAAHAGVRRPYHLAPGRDRPEGKR